MKKKVNIALLVLVLGLWGTIIYKYVSQYFAKNDLLLTNKEYVFDAFQIKEKDTFNLQPLQRDPFLNKSYPVRTNVTTRPKKINTPIKLSPQKPEPKEIITEDFPKIKYYGYIKSEDKKQEVVLLNVNGKLVKLHSNEIKDNIKVISLNKDSVKVGFNKHVKWVKIK